MVAILEKLRTKRQAMAESRAEQYRRLVFAAARSGKVNVDEFAEAADALGLSADDVERDTKAVEQDDLSTKDIERQEADRPRLVKAQGIKQREDELVRELNELRAGQKVAASLLLNIEQCKAEIHRTRSKHPRLWPSTTA